MATRRKSASPAARSLETSRTNDPVPEEASVIEQALALRSTLRDTLGKVNNLVRAIKHQKKQERLLRSTLSSLRQLQSVA